HSITIHDDHGNPIGMRGITMDVTERRLAEAALEESRDAERRFSHLLAQLQDVSNVLSTSETFDDLCRHAVELGRSRLGFERLGIWFIAEDPGMIQGSFGVDESGALRDERPSRIMVPPDSLMGQALAGAGQIVVEEDGVI